MSSDLSECVLKLDSYGVVIERWTSYNFSADFLTPSHGFQFTIGDPDIPQGFAGKIREGLKVGLAIDGVTICTGFIDEVHYECSKDGGTEITITGKDALGDMVESTIDPTVVFTAKQTLADIIGQVAEQYGFYNEPIVDNDANRDLITGNKYGNKVYAAHKSTSTGKHHRRSHRGKSKSKAGQAINSFLEHQAKPYPQEGAYAFCERIANRLGLHMWCTGDGVDLVVGKPNFDQESRYKLYRCRGEIGGQKNNIISGGVTRSREHQPSLIVAGGSGGGGDVARAPLKVIMVNELIARQTDGSLIPQVDQIIKKFPAAYVMGPKDIDGFDTDTVNNVFPPFELNPFPRAKPLYIYDCEARNIEQLKNFVKREMAKRQKKHLRMNYEVMGHSNSGNVWAVDTICSVRDEVADIDQDMYVESVTFTKSRSGGTRTNIVLCLPYTINY